MPEGMEHYEIPWFDARGIPILFDVMEKGEARQARKDAWEHLNAHIAPAPAFHPDSEPAEHAAEIRELRKWWETNRAEVQLR